MTPSLIDASRSQIPAVAFVLLVLPLTACLSYQRQGDRAYEEQRCGEALEFYDRAIEAGTKDAEMFRRAAECALDGGEFSAAERYYSQALRYGGGIDVARDLADFYIKTSNYVSAVRVYQYLLQRVAERQPVYNNLGTALMYAGQYFDAEPYLMIAQQMDPEDPTPYLNLGVLYDRHLRQPWLAINFYDCFLEMSGGPAAERVNQRVSELRSRWERLYQPGVVDCGKPYEPRPTERVADLAEAVEVEGEGEGTEVVLGDKGASQPEDGGETTSETAEAEGGEATSESGEGGETMTEAAEGGESTSRPIDVEAMVAKEDTPDQQPKSKPDSANESALEKARSAFEDERWADTISHISGLPLSRVGAEEERMLGIAYLRQKNWSQASTWLERVRAEDDSIEIVTGLLKAYRRSNEWDRVASLCRDYSPRSEYKKAIERLCEVPADHERKVK